MHCTCNCDIKLTMACDLKHYSFLRSITDYGLMCGLWSRWERKMQHRRQLRLSDVRTNAKARHPVPPGSPQCKHSKHQTPSFTANHTPAPPAASHFLAALMSARSSAVVTRSLKESRTARTRQLGTQLTHSHAHPPLHVTHAAIKSPTLLRAFSTSSTMAPTPSTRAIVISGPSGAGKSTILKRLFDEYPDRFGFSVSHTTRNPRGEEKDGVEYHFVTKDQFNDLVEKKGFVEHATFGSNSYGTSIAAIEDIEKKGRTCILDIEMEVRSTRSIVAVRCGG